ncbi:MAG TPA: tetratricopeptide repeat protein [Planctomycetaceae bacterium]|nr:tetratricopeptide repeat protein [Planctomycetaceae bacterium]
MTFHPEKLRRRHLEAAHGYLLLDLPDQALQELDQIDDPGPEAFEVYRLRGESFLQKQQYRRALEAFEQAETLRPNNLAVGIGRGRCYKRTGQLDRAIATMQTLYRFYPDEPIVLYNLSCYLALAGDKDGALRWLGRALRMEPALRKLIPEDTDFDSLRDDPDFRFVAGIDTDQDAGTAGDLQP